MNDAVVHCRCAAAAFGAVIGSFLNVCIYRLPLGKSIVWPASACAHVRPRAVVVREHADRQLAGAARDVPHVQAPISIRYPIVEALTAVMFARALVVLRARPSCSRRGWCSAAR